MQHREMVIPSASSTVAFVVIVAFVFVAFVAFFARAFKERPNVALLAAALLGGWMGLTACLAYAGVLGSLLGTPRIMLYLVIANGLAVGLALSPVGRTLAEHVPVSWLVGFQAFRLPLELVLHSWYQQGTLPPQMTYSGHNFDIVTGILAVLVAAAVSRPKLSFNVKRTLALGFNVVGFGLLLMVASIAVRSTPGPLQTYENDPPVLLIAYVPYTWILPVCVAGALLGHVLLFRWLLLHRRTSSSG